MHDSDHRAAAEQPTRAPTAAPAEPGIPAIPGYDVLGLLTAVGGKFTTHRRMAEVIPDKIVRRLGLRLGWGAAPSDVRRYGDVSVQRQSCEEMRREVERVCAEHPDRWNCPDCLVQYWPKFREDGLLVHDGRSSVVVIRFCPWCGARLPESLLDLWFEELKALGIDPGEQEVPAPYRSAAWWSNGGTDAGADADLPGD
jgi:hypothetical protein